MDSFLSELVQEGIIVCPSCRDDNLILEERKLSCHKCANEWPIRNGVPDLFNQYTANEATPNVDKDSNNAELDLARSIFDVLELKEEGKFDAVKKIVNRANQWSCESSELAAEINDLKDRFIPGEREIVFPPVAPDANKDPKLRIERHYFPETLSSGASVTANVRMTNCGQYPWSSRAEDPIAVASYWQDQNGRLFQTKINNTRFPIDINPGRSISLPIAVRAPFKAGRYELRVSLEHNGQHFFPDSEMAAIVIKVENEFIGNFLKSVGLRKCGVEPIFGQEIGSYGEDHSVGVKMIEQELQRMNQASFRILEVGSATHPHTAYLPDSKIVAVDISSPLLELGSLYFGDKFSSTLAFLCADAFALPLKKKSFDGIAVFSALHHFAEPEQLLEKLGNLLKPGGFLTVMCEPVSDTLENSDTIGDLLKGINEQVFTWQEYIRIFQKADLRVRKLNVDGASLKAILMPNSSGKTLSFKQC